MNIVYPVYALVALTLFCMVRLGMLRVAAIKRGEIDPRFFALYRGYDEPDKLAAYSRHVSNLFEAPVLFYVICVTAAISGQDGVLPVSIAWAYVALRYVHSYVHLTSNVVIVRFRVFVTSMIVLTALWIVVLTGIMRQ